ncbi:hypothetical protein BY996DRAFT_8687586 [Phakopsora pachyrhizi]|nr:hypothetical protein BY996DRAFT_8687586 [Phakopsora pachyrhizi]
MKIISLRHLVLLYASCQCAAFFSVKAQINGTGGNIPLAQKQFPWPNLPYKADTGSGERGAQSGIYFEILSHEPNSVVGDIEGEMVAFCTNQNHGSRLLPIGAITGLQLTRTPGYIQVVGFVNNLALNIKAGDDGGEADPHGADLRGNPLGGLVYSSAFNRPGTNSFTQVIEWNYFSGSNMFCFKACDPAGANAASLCEHKYDRVGCEYNMPADYPKINGTFQACKGEDQLPVGQYVENGATKTWKQPPEDQGPIKNIPYKAPIPRSSECVFYASTEVFPPSAQATPLSGVPLSNDTTNSTNPKSNSGTPTKNLPPAATGASRSSGAASFSASWEIFIMILLFFTTRYIFN